MDVPVLRDLALGHPAEVVERVWGASKTALVDHDDDVAFADDLVDLGVDQGAGADELLDDGRRRSGGLAALAVH
jgi:hypothetical protein